MVLLNYGLWIFYGLQEGCCCLLFVVSSCFLCPKLSFRFSFLWSKHGKILKHALFPVLKSKSVSFFRFQRRYSKITCSLHDSTHLYLHIVEWEATRISSQERWCRLVLKLSGECTKKYISLLALVTNYCSVPRPKVVVVAQSLYFLAKCGLLHVSIHSHSYDVVLVVIIFVVSSSAPSSMFMIGVWESENHPLSTVILGVLPRPSMVYFRSTVFARKSVRRSICCCFVHIRDSAWQLVRNRLFVPPMMHRTQWVSDTWYRMIGNFLR